MPIDLTPVIIAERERCARIVEALCTGAPDVDAALTAAASAIRDGADAD